MNKLTQDEILIDSANLIKLPINRQVELKNLEFKKTLGEGSYGKVKLAYDKETLEKYAVKIIARNDHDSETIYRITEEIKILAQLQHNKIMRFYRVLKDHSKFYIVMEYVQGGSLKELIEDRKLIGRPLDDKECSQIIKAIAEGLSYLHENSIVHRDLKLENILLQDTTRLSSVKLIDFGLSTKFNKDFRNNLLTEQCGTLTHMAPEIITEHAYTKSVDVWSLGIIMYQLLTLGKHPYYDEETDTTEQFIFKLKNLDTQLFDYSNKFFSDHARHLLTKIFQIDPQKRYFASIILQHPFITTSDLDKNKVKKKIDFKKPMTGDEKIRAFNQQKNLINVISAMLMFQLIKKLANQHQLYRNKEEILKSNLLKQKKLEQIELEKEKLIQSQKLQEQKTKMIESQKILNTKNLQESTKLKTPTTRKIFDSSRLGHSKLIHSKTIQSQQEIIISSDSNNEDEEDTPKIQQKTSHRKLSLQSTQSVKKFPLRGSIDKSSNRSSLQMSPASDFRKLKNNTYFIAKEQIQKYQFSQTKSLTTTPRNKIFSRKSSKDSTDNIFKEKKKDIDNEFSQIQEAHVMQEESQNIDKLLLQNKISAKQEYQEEEKQVPSKFQRYSQQEIMHTTPDMDANQQQSGNQIQDQNENIQYYNDTQIANSGDTDQLIKEAPNRKDSENVQSDYKNKQRQYYKVQSANPKFRQVVQQDKLPTNFQNNQGKQGDNKEQQEEEQQISEEQKQLFSKTTQFQEMQEQQELIKRQQLEKLSNQYDLYAKLSAKPVKFMGEKKISEFVKSMKDGTQKTQVEQIQRKLKRSKTMEIKKQLLAYQTKQQKRNSIFQQQPPTYQQQTESSANKQLFQQPVFFRQKVVEKKKN